MNPPWQVAWPFSMSERTGIASSAHPGAMPRSLMPIAREAASRSHRAPATRSASACAGESVIDPASGQRAADHPRGCAVAVLAIVLGERTEHAADVAEAEPPCPFERADRVIHAFLH